MAIPGILQPQSLLGLYEKFGEENPPLLEQWFPRRPSPDPGQTITYDVIEWSRMVADLNTRDGEPRPVKPAVRMTVTQAALHISESIYIRPSVMKDLRAPGSWQQRNGQTEIARAVKQLRLRMNRRLEILRAQCFGAANGVLSFSIPGVSAAETVDLGYRSTHKAIDTATWSTVGNDILGDIAKAKTKIAQNGGAQATDMIVTGTVESYIRKNTAIINLLSPGNKDKMLYGELPQIMGLNIHTYDAGYTATDAADAAGTLTQFFPGDFAVIFAGDNSNRELRETAPVSIHAPEGYKGAFFKTTLEDRLKGGAWVEYEWSGLPIVANPDEIVYDTDVTPS